VDPLSFLKKKGVQPPKKKNKVIAAIPPNLPNKFGDHIRFPNRKAIWKKGL